MTKVRCDRAFSVASSKAWNTQDCYLFNGRFPTPLKDQGPDFQKILGKILSFA